MFNFLLGKGADLNLKLRRGNLMLTAGEVALECAVDLQMVDTIRLLVDLGVSIERPGLVQKARTYHLMRSLKTLQTLGAPDAMGEVDSLCKEKYLMGPKELPHWYGKY